MPSPTPIPERRLLFVSAALDPEQEVLWRRQRAALADANRYVFESHREAAQVLAGATLNRIVEDGVAQYLRSMDEGAGINA